MQNLIFRLLPRILWDLYNVPVTMFVVQRPVLPITCCSEAVYGKVCCAAALSHSGCVQLGGFGAVDLSKATCTD